MNQDQRKYLITQVENTLKNQVQELEVQKPKQPSLNNYLVAAFLDNSIEFADLSGLKDKIRNRVLRMSQSDVLIEEDNEDNYHYNRRSRSEKGNFVKLVAEEVFIIPQGYLDAMKEYRDKTNSLEGKIKELRAQAQTII